MSQSAIYQERVLPSFGAYLPALLALPAGALTMAPINPVVGVIVVIVKVFC